MSSVKNLPRKNCTSLYELVRACVHASAHLCQTRQGKLLSAVCNGEREATRIESSLGVYQKHPNKARYSVEVGQTQAKKNAPGWTGFHVIVTVNNSRPTRIGFPPMIPAPVKEPKQYTHACKVWTRLFARACVRRMQW